MYHHTGSKIDFILKTEKGSIYFNKDTVVYIINRSAKALTQYNIKILPAKSQPIQSHTEENSMHYKLLLKLNVGHIRKAPSALQPGLQLPPPKMRRQRTQLLLIK